MLSGRRRCDPKLACSLNGENKYRTIAKFCCQEKLLVKESNKVIRGKGFGV